MKRVDCSNHGNQGIGFVCTHVAHAIDRGDDVGFFWGDETDTARPDAWCAKCENDLRATPPGSDGLWFERGEFKILCAVCWDEAKRLCGGLTKSPPAGAEASQPSSMFTRIKR
jgi:hypothetical protein